MRIRYAGWMAMSLGFLACGAALGDGFALKGIDGSSFAPVAEREQVAAIQHRGGVQRMVVTTAFDLDAAERAVWLLPVPGSGATVHVDLWDQFPVLHGRDPVKKASERLAAFFALSRAFSVFAIPLDFFTPSLSRDLTAASAVEQVEKFGVHAETIVAESIDALAAHLAANGVKVGGQTLATLEPYVDGRHVVVAAWVASAAKLRDEFGDRAAGLHSRRPCVYVEFPTSRPFFPMRPTRAYGELEVPLRLCIMGMFRPAVSDKVLAKFDIAVYDRFGLGDGTVEAFLADDDAPRYTVIRASLPASQFDADLEFEPYVPARVRRADWLASAAAPGVPATLSLLALVAAAAYVSAGAAGLVMFGRWRGTAVLGLYMLLTFIGLAYFLGNHDLQRLSERRRNHSQGQVARRFSLWTVVFYIVLITAAQYATTRWLSA